MPNIAKVLAAVIVCVALSYWLGYRSGWSSHADHINTLAAQKKQQVENRQVESTAQTEKVRVVTETKYQTIYRDVVKYVQDPNRTVCTFDNDYQRLRQSALDADAAVSKDERHGVRIIENSTEKH